MDGTNLNIIEIGESGEGAEGGVRAVYSRKRAHLDSFGRSKVVGRTYLGPVQRCLRRSLCGRSFPIGGSRLTDRHIYI